MKLLYRIALAFITSLLPLAALFSAKIDHFLKGRKGLMKKLQDFKRKNPEEIVWFHVASLGEYEQAKPVIANWKERNLHVKICLSFFSPSGYDIAVRKPQPHIDFLTYIPLDRKSWAFDFVSVLNPKLAFFVKYDLWYHHILALKQNNIPIILFSASFRKDQNYFKKDGFFRDILFDLDWIFTQNEESIRLLDSIGYENAEMAGDTRFDRVKETAESPKDFPEIKKWVEAKPVMVLGSVWEEDMQLLIPLINKNPDYLWIIAPHDLSPEPMAKWQQEIQFEAVYYSKTNEFRDAQVLFIDNIGMLSSLYQYARLAYVGGAFGKGLHNILEPLGFGVPVIFGDLKNVSKFPESLEGVKSGCAYSVKDEGELIQVFDSLKDKQAYEKSRIAANQWVNANLGAADKIVNKVLVNFPSNGR